MKKLPLSFLIVFLYSCNALSKPISNEMTQSKTVSVKEDTGEDANLKKQLKEFQKIQREGEFIKLRIANNELMKKLGIRDRSEIFDDDIGSNDKNVEAQKKTFLVSTFKIGKGVEKAKVFVLGRGVMMVKDGDFVMDGVKILSINHGSAKAMVIPTGYIFELPQLNLF